MLVMTCLSVRPSCRWWPTSCPCLLQNSDFRACSWLLSGSVWPSGFVLDLFAFIKWEIKNNGIWWRTERNMLCVFLCNSYHGLGVWFPDMIKYMQFEEYEAKVRVFHRERVERFHFNFSLVNQIHREGEYIHDKWVCWPPSYSSYPQCFSLCSFLLIQVCKYWDEVSKVWEFPFWKLLLWRHQINQHLFWKLHHQKQHFL